MQSSHVSVLKSDSTPIQNSISLFNLNTVIMLLVHEMTPSGWGRLGQIVLAQGCPHTYSVIFIKEEDIPQLVFI